MKRLYLLRHAHAAIGDPLDNDHTRELSVTGKEACARLGAWWAAEKLTVELVLCSTAVRAAQTFEALRAVVSDLPQASYQPKLYLASPPEILKLLKYAGEGAKSILVIGHNPGLHELAMSFSPPHGSLYEKLERGLPPASLLSFQTECAWQDLGERGAELTGFQTV